MTARPTGAKIKVNAKPITKKQKTNKVRLRRDERHGAERAEHQTRRCQQEPRRREGYGFFDLLAVADDGFGLVGMGRTEIEREDDAQEGRQRQPGLGPLDLHRVERGHGGPPFAGREYLIRILVKRSAGRLARPHEQADSRSLSVGGLLSSPFEEKSCTNEGTSPTWGAQVAEVRSFSGRTCSL